MKRSKRQIFRPNSPPAYGRTIGVKVSEQEESHLLRKDGVRRRLIQDLCDICLKYIYVRRDFMSLRPKGWKFCCWKCKKEKEIDLKRDKFIVEFSFQRYIKK